MAKELLAPDYIFEASWEVCNKVGEFIQCCPLAKTLQEAFKDKVFSYNLIFGQERKTLCSVKMRIFVRHGVNML